MLWPGVDSRVDRGGFIQSHGARWVIPSVLTDRFDPSKRPGTMATGLQAKGLSEFQEIYYSVMTIR